MKMALKNFSANCFRKFKRLQLTFQVVMVTLFGLFAEIERTLLSLRTKEALAVAKAAGKRLGRPRGTLGKSKLDGKKEEIQTLLALRVSKASIAKITGVDRATLSHFIPTTTFLTFPLCCFDQISCWLPRNTS
jgi:DNA invertase Pin-like site-specific DNA recombinase